MVDSAKRTPSKKEREKTPEESQVQPDTDNAALAYADITVESGPVKDGDAGTFAGKYEVKHIVPESKDVKDGDPGTFVGEYEVNHVVAEDTSKKSKK